MNIESIAEVKVLTQGYQAEYGRSSGLQITAVTKSGTNRFHGSVYDIEDNSDWNTNSWANQKNGDAEDGVARAARGATRSAVRWAGPAATTSCSSSTATSTGRRRRGGDAQPLPRADGARARGRLLAVARQQRRADSAAARARSRGQPYPGNVIPASELLRPGHGDSQPVPAAEPARRRRRNELQPRDSAADRQEPAAAAGHPRRLPVLARAARHGQVLRAAAAASAWSQGTMPGFNDVLVPYPYISNYGVTVNYTLNPTTFLEAHLRLDQERTGRWWLGRPAGERERRRGLDELWRACR